MHYEDRHYIIFDTSEMYLINLNQILETSLETFRISVDGTKTFVKYDGTMPESVQSLTTRSQEYTHDQMLEILSTSEWNVPIS